MAFLSRHYKASHGEVFKNQNPARGRKHEALSVLMCAVMQFKNQNPARGRSVPPASPARAGEGDRVSGGGGAMNASCNPSIASEMNARHKRPHRLALLATSPVATGEAKIEEPRKGTEICASSRP